MLLMLIFLFYSDQKIYKNTAARTRMLAQQPIAGHRFRQGNPMRRQRDRLRRWSTRCRDPATRKKCIENLEKNR